MHPCIPHSLEKSPAPSENRFTAILNRKAKSVPGFEPGLLYRLHHHGGPNGIFILKFVKNVSFLLTPSPNLLKILSYAAS